MKTVITEKVLLKMEAQPDCEAFLAFKEYCKDNGVKKIPLKELIPLAIEKGFLYDVNWLIVQCMDRKQCIQYAIFAAEQVLPLFEQQRPDDKRPRDAIQTAKAVLKKDSVENRQLAGDAAWAAGDAAGAAWAAGDAARAAWAAGAAAGDAARAAWAAAGDAAWAAGAAAGAARDAAWAAGDAAWAAWDEMLVKIINNGLKIMRLI